MGFYRVTKKQSGEGIPLIEKSGSIVTYEDSVGGVPVNDLVADITPIQASGTPTPTNPLLISGYTEGVITVCGKNLFDGSKVETTSASNWGVTWSNNILTIQHKTSYTTGQPKYRVNLPAGSYKLKGTFVTNHLSLFKDNAYNTVINDGGTFTIEDGHVYDLAFTASQGQSEDYSGLMLFPSSQEIPSEYISYNGQTESRSFGQTVYGGTWKASQGKVVDVPIKVKFSDIPQANWRYSNNSGNWNSYLFFADLSMRARATTGLSNVYAYQPNTSEANVSNNSYVLPSWNTYVYIRDDSITSIADFLQAHGDDYIIMKPATPTEITVEPVLLETIEGENNVFANTGDLTAKFYKSSVSNLDTLVEQTKDLAPDIIALASAGNGTSTREAFDMTDETTGTKATRIPDYMFYKNLNVEKINLSTVESVGSNTFYMCPYLKEINLPNATELKSSAFNASSRSLVSTTPMVINLPSCTNIADSALREMGYAGVPTTLTLTACETVSANSVRGASGRYFVIDTLDLPAVKTIGQESFNYHQFTNVIIGTACTSIASKPFNYCTITNLTVKATTPPTLNANGLGCTPTHIYVPSDSVATYKAASNWSTYSSIIEAIPT